MSPDGTRRSDALRNRRSVIEAGTALLTRDPDMSIQQIADASGLGRTTVYRHFPNRELLLEAVLESVMENARRSLAEPEVDPAEPEAAIRTLSDGIMGLGLEYGDLIAKRDGQSAVFEAAKEADGSPTRRFLEQARDRATISTGMSLRWQRSVMQAVPLAAVDEVRAGTIGEDEARRLAGDTLASILLSRAR